MMWYWQVLIAFVYLFGMGASTGIGIKEERRNPNNEWDIYIGVICGMVWPIVLPYYLGLIAFRGKKK